MTAVQIKKEISKVLDQVPENLLVDILDFIKEVQSDKSADSSLTSNFKKILSEDGELLQKLAK
ncbi:MAG: hypothetical protein CFE23_16545 [Flavobacterium sp. BFFFF1]|uniref:hypothetical protein n=1 Tax=Flavobacterium sp. BFFFF1 TaxID=2015557 RepID=UPI000BD770DF|nr:hypothetical protein [Flavobacterium sp. BFFFF1]OYU78885.1 MAG: hypothetical protein CFE23_16545 [Flavobacterium sp. BFFFF1]